MMQQMVSNYNISLNFKVSTDGITTSQYIDMDANGSNEFDLARVFKGIGCGTIN